MMGFDNIIDFHMQFTRLFPLADPGRSSQAVFIRWVKQIQAGSCFNEKHGRYAVKINKFPVMRCDSAATWCCNGAWSVLYSAIPVDEF